MKKIKNFLKKINVHIRHMGIMMFCIYLIGGVIPMIFVTFLQQNNMTKVLTEQAENSEYDELSLIMDDLAESISIMRDASLSLYFVDEIERIAFTQFNDYQSIYTAFINIYSNAMQENLQSYNNIIKTITIFFENDTIPNNSYFQKIDDNVRNKEWYKRAIEANGRAVWVYRYEPTSRKNYLFLSRVLKTEKGKMTGIATLSLYNERFSKYTSTRDTETAFFLNNKTMLYTNTNDSNEDEIAKLLSDQEENPKNRRVTYKGEDYLMTVVDYKIEHATDTISLVSLQKYSVILEDVYQKTRTDIITISAAIILSIFIIAAYSFHSNKQISKFKNQMHEAAAGNFNIAKSIGGSTEISQLYEELGIMINQIQYLLRNSYEEQIKRDQIEQKQREVEFKMLASQINPHFLYNTLETIRMMAVCNNEPEIAEIVKMLAKILRRNIQASETQVTLKEEIELVEYYLKIQKYRFGDRISYNININCDIETAKIQPLLIQPIVENAVVHGLEEKRGDGGHIEITIEHTDCLRIQVEDNGIGIDEQRLSEIRDSLRNYDNLDRTHIGLINVSQRIKLLYGEEYGMYINSEQGKGTSIVLTIPDKIINA